MNNQERREQLIRARTNAVSWADIAEGQMKIGSQWLNDSLNMAAMWADVAQALKKEDSEHS